MAAMVETEGTGEAVVTVEAVELEGLEEGVVPLVLEASVEMEPTAESGEMRVTAAPGVAVEMVGTLTVGLYSTRRT